ncbi:MAG: AraC family transcriptional regulator [Armatimonadetes bacterium]|nr:AraC family transcriptional regulator [Armatimonadota bacterium]
MKSTRGVHFVSTKTLTHTVKPRHSHSFAYLNFIVEGSVHESFECGEEVTYEPFRIRFHPRDEVQVCEIGSHGVQAFAIVPDPETIKRLLRHGIDTATGGTLDAPYAEEFARKLPEIFAKAGQKDDPELFALFDRFLDKAIASNRERGTSVQPWLIQAKEFIQSHPERGLTLIEVAAESGVHPVHLAQQFKRRYGMTVGSYVRCLRMERAKHWLKDTRSTISEVANKLGFYDHAHFVKVFKSYTKMTPSMYRKELSQQ